MTQIIHKTNRLSPKPPDATEIQQGEICLNTYNLGSSSNGINNGRLYIKTDNDEVRRFISLGLPGSSDPSLKTKYGGSNNTFASVVDNSDTSYDSLMVFQYSSLGNHLINKTTENKLTWSSGDNRLNVNRSSAAQATLHVGGDVCIDTVNAWSTSFTSNFQIIGRDIGDNNRLKQVSSASLLALTPSNTIPANSISGAIPLNKGGTGADLTSFSPSEGNILYYSVSGSRFDFDSDIRWDSTNNLLILTGGFEFNPPSDALNNASPIGVDSSNRIVRMDYTYNQDLNNDDDVTFNTLTLDNNGFDAGVLTVNNMQTDGSPYNAVPVGVDASDRIVKMYYTYNQNLNTTDNVDFEKITINGNTGPGATLVLTNLQSSTGGTALEIDGAGYVYKSSSTRKLKENIVEYDKGLEEVLLMNPKYFNMINDPNKTIRAGLIAEDLADIGLDEFVVKDSDDNPSAINYDKIVVVLINAIKELKNRLDNISSN